MSEDEGCELEPNCEQVAALQSDSEVSGVADAVVSSQAKV